jgi:hypothetical protein
MEGLMAERVRVGKLPSGDYGLRVVSADGATVIIDGTSNMFKISATGTLTITLAAGDMTNSAEITLYGLGVHTIAPAFTAYASTGTAATEKRRFASFFDAKGVVTYTALTSGGSPTSVSTVGDSNVYGETRLDSAGVAVFQIEGSRSAASDLTFYYSFYIFQEGAL